MTKVTRPLFSDEARGPIGNAGTFRMGRHGPEFMKIREASATTTEAQARIRECFAAAKAAHSLIEPTVYAGPPRIKRHRVPSWPDFWAQWLIDHPECTA